MQNLITNPGFEAGETGWNWTEWGLNGVAGNAHSGEKAAYIYGDLENEGGFWKVIDRSTNWVDGSTLQFSCWMMRTGTYYSDAVFRVWMPMIDGYENISLNGSSVAMPETELNVWTYIEKTFTAPVGTTGFRISISGTSNDEESYLFDDFALYNLSRGVMPRGTTTIKRSVSSGRCN